MQATTQQVPDIQAAFDSARELAVKFGEGAGQRDRERAFPTDELSELRRSGLLAFMVPRASGGLGGSIVDQVRIIGILAEGDPNIAQMYVVHTWLVDTITKASTEFASEFYEGIVHRQVFWTNGFSEIGTKHVLDYTVSLTAVGSDWRLNGSKFYCTGSLGADEIYLTAVVSGTDEIVIAFVSLDEPGVEVVDDWTGMGQRTTSSGTTRFADVQVPAHRVLRTEFLSEPTSLASVFTQAMHSAILVAIARNALKDTVDYTRSRRRPWVHSGVEKATQDPYILLNIGQMQTWCDAIHGMQERSFDAITWAEENSSPENRSAAMVATLELKSLATELGLRICEMLFQVAGASATVEKYNYDRHWRNLRTLSLHDPLEYKLRLIGDYTLNGTRPPVTSYT